MTLVWIVNGSPDRIECPTALSQCPGIDPGETHRDTRAGHVIENTEVHMHHLAERVTERLHKQRPTLGSPSTYNIVREVLMEELDG